MRRNDPRLCRRRALQLLADQLNTPERRFSHDRSRRRGKRRASPPTSTTPPTAPTASTIVEASAFTGRDGRHWAKCVLTPAGGPDVGRRFDHFMNLNNDVGMRIARESLVTYGLDPTSLDNPGADIETLHTAMQPLVGMVAHITVTHKDGFRNIRVDGAQTTISDITPPTPAAAGGSHRPPPPPPRA